MPELLKRLDHLGYIVFLFQCCLCPNSITSICCTVQQIHIEIEVIEFVLYLFCGGVPDTI